MLGCRMFVSEQHKEVVNQRRAGLCVSSELAAEAMFTGSPHARTRAHADSRGTVWLSGAWHAGSRLVS